jgi:hypothetical protein
LGAKIIIPLKQLFENKQSKYDYRQVFLDFNHSLHTIKDLKIIRMLDCKPVCPLKANNQFCGVVFLGEKDDKKAYQAKDIEIRNSPDGGACVEIQLPQGTEKDK